MSLSNKKILIIMSGSIASFKACGVISKLVQAGADVKVVQSRSSTEFIGNATIEGLIGKPAIRDDMFAPGTAMDHIYLMREADLVLVCPATANFINKIANGIGDDLLSTLFLAHDFKKPFLIAPAMNTSMYLHPVTQSSIQKLRSMGIEILETASGVLACGETGLGKLLEPDSILNAIESTTSQKPADHFSKVPLSTRNQILITGGGTIEPIDQVRFIANHSTGKTAARLAESFFDLGFEVTYLGSKNSVKPNREIKLLEYVTFNDLQKLLKETLRAQNFLAAVHLAAVSDYSVATVQTDSGADLDQNKISSGLSLTLKLKPNPKLVASLREWSLNKKIHLTAFKMTVQATESQAKESIAKIFSQSAVDQVLHNDTSYISETKHEFKIYNRSLEVIGKGDSKSQMASVLYSLLPQEVK